ncbi:MAG: hypothetical protein ACLFRF_03980 [Desulfobacterales bacterium]
MTDTEISELDAFLNQWTDSANQAKNAFLELLDHLKKKDPINLEFIPREGLTYSLRASHPNQTARPLFGMVDVIEDDPRWLSVCFFGEMINDPEEKGDMVPEGLLGEDAHCFDIYEYEASEVAYVARRLDEAYEVAAKG